MRRMTILAILAGCILSSSAFCQGWDSFTTANSDIASDSVSAVAVDVSDRIYIGTDDSGLSVVQGSEWLNFTTSNSSLISNRIKALACDSSERVFIGTDIGVSIFSDAGWQTFTTANSGLSDNWIEAIAIAPDDVAWVGTHSGGLCSYDGASWRQFRAGNSGIASDRISAVAVDDDGAVWVGTRDAGLSVKTGSAWTVYDTSNSRLLSNNVKSIGLCPSGAVWIGTSNGLCAYRDGVFQDETSLVFDADVRAVIVDDFGYRWFGLRTGVVRFDGRDTVDYDNEVSNACATSVAQGTSAVYLGSREHGLLFYEYNENLPPLMPQTPSGPTTGKTDAALEFSTFTTDPEGDDVRYQFDWDDGSVSPWGPATQSHAYTNLGPYTVIVRARDEGDNVSAFSEAHTITITTANRPPQAPTIPRGPESAYLGETVEFSTSSYDPDGDELEFMFDWGDGNQSSWGAATRTWIYHGEGTFSVKARARDDKGKASTWSAAASIRIEEPNSAPTRPEMPSGPSSGLVNTEYEFTTSSTDPDGDDVWFLFDWGDGEDSGWGPATASHAYKRTGTFDICVLAEDEHGAQSNWSSYHSIEISGTPKPIIELGSTSSRYYLGDTIELYGTLINDLDEMTVDIYVAALLPGSDTLLFYPTFSADPFPIRVTLGAQSEFGPYVFLEYQIASHIPLGDYIFYGALVAPGTQFDFVSDLEILIFSYAGERQD